MEGKVGVPELGPPAPDHGGQKIAVVEGFISRCIAFALVPDRAAKPVVQQGMNHAVVKGRPIVVGDRLFVSLGLLEGLDRGGTDPRLNPGVAAACENQTDRNLAVFLQMVAERIGDTGPPASPLATVTSHRPFGSAVAPAFLPRNATVTSSPGSAARQIFASVCCYRTMPSAQSACGLSSASHRAQATRTRRGCWLSLSQGNRIKKNGVILRRSDARRAQVAGIAQPKNPVECRNDVRSCLMILPGLTGSFDSVPPRLRPRSTALRMTAFFDAIALKSIWLLPAVA